MVIRRDGDYQIQNERRKILRKLDNSKPNPEVRYTPLWLWIKWENAQSNHAIRPSFIKE